MSVVRTLLGNIKGPQGETGAQGAQGAQGEAATIQVGSVTTTAYGNPAQVINSGTESEAVLDFVIPQGKPGEATTTMGNLLLDAITTSTASFPSPQVGDTGKTVFGKIVKFFADTVAALNTKLNAANVVNNLTTTEAGYALDARQGKALNDSLTKSRNAGTYNETFNVFAYGFVTNSSKTMFLCIPMLGKVNTSQISFSKIIASLRAASGGYVISDGTDIVSYVSGTNFFADRGYAMVQLTKADGWNITNNANFCGFVQIGYTIS